MIQNELMLGSRKVMLEFMRPNSEFSVDDVYKKLDEKGFYYLLSPELTINTFLGILSNKGYVSYNIYNDKYRVCSKPLQPVRDYLLANY